MTGLMTSFPRDPTTQATQKPIGTRSLLPKFLQRKSSSKPTTPSTSTSSEKDTPSTRASSVSSTTSSATEKQSMTSCRLSRRSSVTTLSPPPCYEDSERPRPQLSEKEAKKVEREAIRAYMKKMAERENEMARKELRQLDVAMRYSGFAPHMMRQ